MPKNKKESDSEEYNMLLFHVTMPYGCMDNGIVHIYLPGKKMRAAMAAVCGDMNKFVGKKLEITKVQFGKKSDQQNALTGKVNL